MYTKLTLLFALMMVLIAAFGEIPSFFGQSPNDNQSNNASTTQPSVLSPNQFRDKVNNLYQQNLDSINNELKSQHQAQQYPKNPSFSPFDSKMGTNANSPTPPTDQTKTSEPTPPPPVESNQTPPITTNQAATPNPPEKIAPPSAVPPPPANPSKPSTPRPPAVNYGIQPSGGEPDTYMGFGGDKKAPASPPSSNVPSSNGSDSHNKSNWNIKY